MLLESGDFAGVREVLERVRPVARLIGDERLHVRTQVTHHALTLYAADEHAEAGAREAILADGQNAVALFRTLGDDANLARTWRLIAHAHAYAGRFDEAARSSESSVCTRVSLETPGWPPEQPPGWRA